jgi:3-oxoacyl-[acyl-carrier protein] reductase
MNAIVTAATKGIGRAIAIKLAEQGYDLAICSRNEEELMQLADQLKYTGVKIFYSQTDCSVKEEVYQFCARIVQHFGPIDVLVNNAGLFLTGSLLDEEDESLESQQRLNVNAAYYFAKYFGKMMRKQQHGHIFNMCSIASKVYLENAGSYSVTKAALLSLNNVLRQELSKYNVKVTAILPGSTLTSSWEGTQIPPAKFVQPEDVAKTLITILNLSDGANVDEIVIRPLDF